MTKWNWNTPTSCGPGQAESGCWPGGNCANIASFRNALDYLKANPDADPQTILAVRNGEKIKYGLGVNIEQALTDNLGFSCAP